MRLHTMTIALLSGVLVAGCGDRSAEQAPAAEAIQSTDSASPAEATAPGATDAAQAAPAATSAVAPAGTTARTTPARPSSTARPAPTARPRAETPEAGSGTRADTRGDSLDRPAPVAPTPEYAEVTVPAGTTVPLELLTALSSETAAVETPVRARLRQALLVNGRTAIPAGSVFSGTVTEVEKAGRVQGRSHLAIRFDSVQVRGTRERVRTNTLTFQGAATKGEDVSKIGAGAGVGALIGGILGGGKGAAKGAAIGGAAGTGVVLATRGKEVTLAEGADVSPTLASGFTVQVPLR